MAPRLVLLPLPSPDPATTAAALIASTPRVVALPLLPLEFDLIDLLGELGAQGYPGRILILGPPLPQRGLVERELRAQAPQVRLQLVLLAALAP